MIEMIETRVGEIGRIITGKTPKTSVNEYYGGIIPFITPSDDMLAKHIYSTKKTLTDDGAKSVKNCIIPARTICVSCIGSDLGKVVITTKKSVTNQQINSIIVNEKKYDVDFIYYVMKELGKIMNHHSKTSTAVPIINKSQFSDYTFMCPELTVQKKIGAILSSLDRKIENNKAVCNNLWAQIDAFFTKLYNGSNVEKRTFGDVVTRCTERAKNEALKVLSPISSGEIVLSEEYFTKQVHSKDIAKYIKVAPYEFCYNPARANIGSIGMNDFSFSGCVSPVYVVFRTSNLLRFYMSRYFKKDQFKAEVITRSSGSVRQALRYEDLCQIEFLCPCKEQLEEFNSFYTTLKRKIDQVNTENSILVELRDSLAPRLMTGDFDVSAIEI